ncbi:MAG: nitroreductase/quinone reductase family protein [Myxococcota bacterium]
MTRPTTLATLRGRRLGWLVLATVASLSCGPWGPQGILAGGPFLGSPSEQAIEDWSFTDAEPLIAIETRGRLFRHTVTIVCVAAERRLYVMARHAPRKRWVQNLAGDPRVRLRIGEELYEGRAVRVSEPAESAAVARAFLRKYVGLDAPHARGLFFAPEPGDDRAEVWTWRIDPAEKAG